LRVVLNLVQVEVDGPSAPSNEGRLRTEPAWKKQALPDFLRFLTLQATFKCALRRATILLSHLFLPIVLLQGRHFQTSNLQFDDLPWTAQGPFSPRSPPPVFSKA
jgi:hypothetical protein